MNTITYDKIISVENLLLAWEEFKVGKKSRRDVQEFQLHFMDHVLNLQKDLKNKTYIHGEYYAFNISDPKPRNIHKATVRDRLLHHAIYRILYPYFDTKFIADSYSCRLNKGTHKALNRFRTFHRKVSKNNTTTCWVLKCDIRKFFANIDHDVLKHTLSRTVLDTDVLWLLGQVIGSFPARQGLAEQGLAETTQPIGNSSVVQGLPLGNLTSQLLVNIYMNEFDQYVKRVLKQKYYIRYADDFVFMAESREELINLLPKVQTYLNESLRLSLHPDKVFISTLASGVDFLGWVHFPHHRVLRTTTKRRMLKNVDTNQKPATRASYLGMLRHGNGYKLGQSLKS